MQKLLFILIFKELITTQADKRRLEEENNKLDEQLKEVSVEYSNRLQHYIHDISVSIYTICNILTPDQESIQGEGRGVEWGVAWEWPNL